MQPHAFQRSEVSMRRVVLFAVGVALLGAAFIWGAAGSAADATPTVAEVHPIVGSWDVERTSPGDSSPESMLITFAADGTVIATDEDGLTWHGAWISTGPRSVDYSYVTLGSEQMPDGAVFIRAGGGRGRRQYPHPLEQDHERRT
jgi:hypothetical protein